MVAFFCQQAVEKALKAVYIKKFNELAGVHDLVFLGRRLGLPKELLEGCGYLNRAYTESRYPGETEMPAEKFSEEDAGRCIAIAEEVLEWTKNALMGRLRAFKKALSAVLPIEKMIFFGSRAEGHAEKWSDIDLIVVSKDFRGKRPLERGLELYEKWDMDYPVDFLCYTPEEFEKAKKMAGIVSHALKHGLPV